MACTPGAGWERGAGRRLQVALTFAAATIVTSNLPFQEWTTVFASERLTGALLDRITHHVHILEMNGESYRLKQSRSTTPATVLNNPPLAPWAHRPLYGRLPVAKADSVLRENPGCSSISGLFVQTGACWP